MLVQYLLKTAVGEDYKQMREVTKQAFTEELTPLVVDGRFGPNTARWIYFFQQIYAQQKGYPLGYDGIVSPLPAQLTRLTARRYIMGALNDLAEFKLMARFHVLPSDPATPGPLRDVLRSHWK